jgi:glycine cleavage system H protein
MERYTKDHEYIRVEGDVGVIGITQHAQEQLGDVVFVEVPAIGKVVQQGDQAGVVESVKAASDIYAPVSGEVVAANADLAGDPALINQDPMGRAWFMKIKLSNKAELDGLMDKAAYEAFLAEG